MARAVDKWDILKELPGQAVQDVISYMRTENLRKLKERLDKVNLNGALWGIVQAVGGPPYQGKNPEDSTALKRHAAALWRYKANNANRGDRTFFADADVAFANLSEEKRRSLLEDDLKAHGWLAGDDNGGDVLAMAHTPVRNLYASYAALG
ncbi:hypothetical protein K470DRAFT_288681 [Piedraia hortae CBS 480.64]|uniref:Uncharacterized protein n=1 Tax=Piedraia hortae CBS 480.64 TaxID=1314780 RepID=A0A6A7BUX7_9PEZI|nr:hypothetical protein K470DRAFT_288681 [Piedraia hortae CBS 480.64]